METSEHPVGTLDEPIASEPGARDVVLSAPPVVHAGRFRQKFREYLPALFLFIGVIALWQLVTSVTSIPPYILPKPTDIAKEIWDERGSLFPAAGTTGEEVLIGFLLAVTFGYALAVLFTYSKIAERAIYPIVIASQTIPILAIAPLLVVWFGFGILPKVLVVALFGFFPVAINTVAGMSSVERDTFLLMRSFGASRWETFRRVRFPASLPFFFTGVKQAAVISVIGAVAGEWVGADKGMGPLMIAANSYLRTSLVFAAIIYLSVMAVGMFLIVSVVERLTIRWYFVNKEQRSRG
jgi:ABC-type nitrate/sulfonate/bicarbonate transport system permease component